MNRIMLWIAGVLLFAANAASAAPRYLYEFPWQPPNGVVAKMLQSLRIDSPPAIVTDQEIRVEDATMVLESGTYDSVYISSVDLVLVHNINITGSIIVEPGAHILPASQNSGITVQDGATANWGAPGGEFVQILGDPATTDREFDTSGIQVGPNSSTVIHNVLVTGVGYGMFTMIPTALQQYTPSPTMEATNLYLTNNRIGIGLVGSCLINLHYSASWGNQEYAISTNSRGDYIMTASQSLFLGKIGLDQAQGFYGWVVFDQCTMPEGFVDWLFESQNTIITVLQKRPAGLGQTHTVQAYPLTSKLPVANFTGTGEVNTTDARLLAANFGNPRDAVEYGDMYDLNADGEINMPDVEDLAYAFAGISRSEPLSVLAASPKLPELIQIVVEYPAVVEAAHNDPGIGSLILTYLDELNPTAVADLEAGVPGEFSLGQNYPNPFNSGTTIRFQIPEESNVVLAVYNTAGQEVARLVDETLQTGSYTQSWDGMGADGHPAASGTYFYRLTAGTFTETHRMALLW